MDSSHSHWDLEAGNAARCPRVSGHESPLSTNDYSSDGSEKAAGQCPESPRVWQHYPITTQRDHFLAAISESLSVGLGLGSAVGIWACIHDTIKRATPENVHIANWTAGLIMGFVLAPLLEKAARVFFGKAGAVLVKPQTQNIASRFIDHAITICSALLGVGLCKGVQMQYHPLHTNLGFEYAVFVVGFTIYAFLRVTLYTIGTRHDYDGDKIECAWTEVPSVVFWEFLDHFCHVYIIISVNIRDFLTFAIYPYLMTIWIGYWEKIDPEGKFTWLPQMLNIGFFFTFFSMLKETTFLLARLFWSEDLPVHRHHGM